MYSDDDYLIDREECVNAYYKELKQQIETAESTEEILEIVNNVIETKDKKIKELEEQLKNEIKGRNILAKLNEDSIPKLKVKDVLTEIQKEYNKVQEQFDCIWNKKSKDNYDRYKLQELSAVQQELGFILGKLEKILEEK